MVLLENIHLGVGYLLLLNPVGTAQLSRTKSESLCYHLLKTGDNSGCFSLIYAFFYIVLFSLDHNLPVGIHPK